MAESVYCQALTPRDWPPLCHFAARDGPTVFCPPFVQKSSSNSGFAYSIKDKGGRKRFVPADNCMSPCRAEPPMHIRSLSELTPRPLAWFWPGRLALGKLAILDGDPGLGKSLVALDLCARLSTGSPFPDGRPSPGSGNALVLNGEDGAEDTIRPRLQTLGAALERVFVPHSETSELHSLLRLPAQTALLDEALARTQARLLVLDPIVAFLDASIQIGNDASVRGALMPLAQLAAKHRCAVLMVRHLNKRGAGSSIYRGGGSIGFLGACRSGWLIARSPRPPGYCVFAQVKNNLAAPQPSLAYEVLAYEAAIPSLCWRGSCAWTADELLGKPIPAVPRQRAADFLAAFLEDGPRTAREVWEAARRQQLAERTLNRAKRELKVRSLRVSVEGIPRSYWLLPGQKMPDGISPRDASADLEPWLAPLRERFPPATPLEDL